MTDEERAIVAGKLGAAIMEAIQKISLTDNIDGVAVSIALGGILGSFASASARPDALLNITLTVARDVVNYTIINNQEPS